MSKSVYVCIVGAFFLFVPEGSKAAGACDDRFPVQCPFLYEYPKVAEVVPETTKAEPVRKPRRKVERSKHVELARSAPAPVDLTPAATAWADTILRTAQIPAALEISLAAVPSTETVNPNPSQSCLMQTAFNDIFASIRPDPHFADSLLLRGLRSRKSASNASPSLVAQ